MPEVLFSNLSLSHLMSGFTKTKQDGNTIILFLPEYINFIYILEFLSHLSMCLPNRTGKEINFFADIICNLSVKIIEYQGHWVNVKSQTRTKMVILDIILCLCLTEGYVNDISRSKLRSHDVKATSMSNYKVLLFCRFTFFVRYVLREWYVLDPKSFLVYLFSKIDHILNSSDFLFSCVPLAMFESDWYKYWGSFVDWLNVMNLLCVGRA